MTARGERWLAWSLAWIAGGLNSAGFYVVGLYSSNMTGNVSSLADHLAVADFAVAATYLALVLTFILGAMTSALLIAAGRRRQFVGIYVFSLYAEAALLAALALTDLLLAGPARAGALVFGLSFLMGLQNATVTRISDARIRTTHVTGMVTDIGIELGHLLDRAWSGRRGGTAGRDYDAEKLRLHGITVVSFCGGGVAGVTMYRAAGAYALFGAAALLLVLARSGIARRRSRPAP